MTAIRSRSRVRNVDDLTMLQANVTGDSTVRGVVGHLQTPHPHETLKVTRRIYKTNHFRQKIL